MGTVLPSQDLHLMPSTNTATGAAGTVSITLLTPKIEPKTEPSFEERIPTHQLVLVHNTQEVISSESATGLFSNPENTPESQPSDQYRSISELFKYGDVEVLDPDSRAIVSVNQDAQLSIAVLPRPKVSRRSGDLVRVTDLSDNDEKNFREDVRRTRMLYDSLRILAVYEEEKIRESGQGKRLRADLNAGSVMKELWLYRDKRVVGSIPGVQIGDVFLFRMELVVVGLHGHPQAGIDYLPASQSATGEPIATSIIVSGGYEDDEDAGDVIIYTGQGGQDKLFKQCENQKLVGGNLAMERSMHHGIEVRVIRGFKYHGAISSKVYVYDGLYKIHDCWFEVGKSGFGVYKYKLMRIEGQPEMGSTILRFADSLRTKPLSVGPKGYLSLDISGNKETIPVLLFNDIDGDYEPLYYAYLARTVFPPFLFNQGCNGDGCDCVLVCNERCICATKNGGEFAYDHNGYLLRGKPVIFECGAFCRCPPHCRNRVTQRGLRNRLEVFRSRETSWGVRSLELIHAGTFICEYTGVVLTKEQAQIFSMNGDSLIYPHRFSARWREWGDLSQVLPNYMHPSNPSLPPLDFAMDVSKMRNVACYISHSSTPNVMVQFVLYDHNNLMFPHLMLFALENIPPLRELSLDYGVSDDWSGKLAICN